MEVNGRPASAGWLGTETPRTLPTTRSGSSRSPPTPTHVPSRGRARLREVARCLTRTCPESHQCGFPPRTLSRTFGWRLGSRASGSTSCQLDPHGSLRIDPSGSILQPCRSSRHSSGFSDGQRQSPACRSSASGHSGISPAGVGIPAPTAAEPRSCTTSRRSVPSGAGRTASRTPRAVLVTKREFGEERVGPSVKTAVAATKDLLALKP